jgi:alkanesulfonate monooxygenase SsuD/methylene tetrahydromethanopterin reductase-like flavin-dependent oxidoreductase (luciferase family)
VKFSIAVNMERYDSSVDIREVAANALTLVQLAEQGGFEIAWAAEHHTIELLVAPNPFNLLTYWAAHTKTIRLGTAVVVAPYWHPIRAAGEAALFDVLSNGRLEFGISRGAFQYEFDRMAGGIPQQQGVAHVKEMLPAIQALWRGDYEHRGELWRFPKATSVPKPLQKPHPPVWVAARDAGTFEWAVEHGAHIMATPLSRPHAEVGILGRRYRETLAKFPGRDRPRFLMLRRTCVYERPEDWRIPVDASIQYARRFETLFRNIGGVENGFPEPTDLDQLADRDDFRPESIRDAMVFGTPDEVLTKLKSYEAAGVDQFCYGANFGLAPAAARRSLELFITEVMPHFAETAGRARPLPAQVTA